MYVVDEYVIEIELTPPALIMSNYDKRIFVIYFNHIYRIYQNNAELNAIFELLLFIIHLFIISISGSGNNNEFPLAI